MEIESKIYIAFGEDEGVEQDCVIAYDETAATTDGDGRAVPEEIEITSVTLFNEDDPVNILPVLSDKSEIMANIISYIKRQEQEQVDYSPAL